MTKLCVRDCEEKRIPRKQRGAMEEEEVTNYHYCTQALGRRGPPLPVVPAKRNFIWTGGSCCSRSWRSRWRSHPVRNCKIKLLACESLNVEPEPELEREKERLLEKKRINTKAVSRSRQKEGKITQQFQTQEKTTHSHTHIFTKTL